LADHNLNYTDKLSMATGVEVRVPLLDPELVNFAAALPLRYKQRGSVGKWVFKKSMENILPKEIIYRPKSGFGVPLRRWLHCDYTNLTDSILGKESIQRRGLFDPSAIRNLISADKMGRINATYTIFALICIEIWCRLFLDGQPYDSLEIYS